MSRILIIDDDRQLTISFSKILTEQGYTTVTALSGLEGIDAVKSDLPDLVILDIRLPDMSGLQVFQIIHELYPKLPVVIITATASTETAIGAIQGGAYDYIYKPFDVPEMLQLIEKAIFTGRCMSSPVEVNPELGTFTGKEALVGGSKQMLDVYKAIGRVSSTDATVLIRGESGTGKELVSRAIYNHSSRVDKAFMVVNCVAIPDTLLESELFGYEQGTFTGASHRRLGKIEQARGGTVFLDEVGDMPLTLQAKLLRLLQENSIERLGGREPINVNVRIIAATNKDLEAAIVKGTFREDLYYRLRVVTITMPPLRERKEDIEILVSYLLARLAKSMSIRSPGITREALDKLSRYGWPGNIRELGNTLKKTLIFNRGAPVLPDDITFPSIVQSAAGRDTSAAAKDSVRSWVRSVLESGEIGRSYDYCMDCVGSILIREALRQTKGNRTHAAKVLGISRPTLHAKMEKYQVDRDEDSPE